MQLANFVMCLRSGIRMSDFGSVGTFEWLSIFQYAVHVRGICKLRLDKIGTIVSVRLEVQHSSYKIIIEKP